jgi:pilus assembly protein TadC
MLITQLARVQISGASAADAVRRMLEADAARDRAQQLAKTKALPVRLMVPLTLMILPGVVLLVYGPTLIDVLGQVMDPFG